LNKLGVPSAKDVNELIARIDALNASVQKLSASKAKPVAKAAAPKTTVKPVAKTAAKKSPLRKAVAKTTADQVNPQ